MDVIVPGSWRRGRWRRRLRRAGRQGLDRLPMDRPCALGHAEGAEAGRAWSVCAGRTYCRSGWRRDSRLRHSPTPSSSSKAAICRLSSSAEIDAGGQRSVSQRGVEEIEPFARTSSLFQLRAEAAGAAGPSVLDIVVLASHSSPMGLTRLRLLAETIAACRSNTRLGGIADIRRRASRCAARPWRSCSIASSKTLLRRPAAQISAIDIDHVDGDRRPLAMAKPIVLAVEGRQEGQRLLDSDWANESLCVASRRRSMPHTASSLNSPQSASLGDAGDEDQDRASAPRRRQERDASAYRAHRFDLPGRCRSLAVLDRNADLVRVGQA